MRSSRGFAKSVAIVGASLAVAGCSPAAGPGETVTAAVTQDSATRTSVVVVGRPARVFVYTALGKNCARLPAPSLRIVTNPARGEVSFREGQATSIASASNRACVGRPATGTGVYYTASGSAAGVDRFTIEARATDGSIQSRTFEVRIEP